MSSFSFFFDKQTLATGVGGLFSQMNCTGDAGADRLSAQCYGNVAGRPVEVRAFRSYRPHTRLCYGLSLSHFSLSAQAKGCLSPSGQRELRTNLTHSLPLLTYLGVPSKSGLRLLLRLGAQRWALGIGLGAGPWIMDLNVGLRAERVGLYGWHGLLQYGRRGATSKAEVTGRATLESWCHIWADVNAASDTVSSSLLVSARCKGVGRLVWELVWRDKDGAPVKTSLTAHGQAGKDGFKGSLGLENQQDFLQCVFSALLKDRRAALAWTFQHQWTPLITIIPNRMDLRGSGQLHDTSFTGGAQVSFNTRSAHIDITTAWESSTSFKVSLQQNVATGAPRTLTVGAVSTADVAQFEVESDVCSLLLLARTRLGKRSSWKAFAHQQCVFLKVRQEASVRVKELVSQRRKAEETSSHRR